MSFISKLSIISIFLIPICVFAQGITDRIPDEPLRVGDKTEAKPQVAMPKIVTQERPKAFVNLLDSLAVEVVLEPGEWEAVYVDVTAGTLGYTPPEPAIDTSLIYWVDWAPLDLQRQLRLNLVRLSPYMLAYYADMLASADPLWLDELYYCLAHLAVEILELDEMSFLLPENVREIYARDSLLSYVEIIDDGHPGGLYHKTYIRYITTDTFVVGWDTVTLDPEMYYRYVMFPKITDEIPRYICPPTGEPADPWTGKFWRTWFWDVAETTGTFECWALGESLATVGALWNGFQNSDTDNGAIGIVSRWIKNSLDFDSDAERPHQPVRIYAKHKGRCGEHADITTAACRTGLIPCRNIESISTDHTWNEFFTGWRWASFEPVNTHVDDQWAYNAGGRNVGTVYEYTGKGSHLPVTDRYSHEIADFNLSVIDASGRPIDGARVMIAMERGEAIYYDCILTTGSRGKAYDMVGDNRHFYWRVDTEIGCNPEPGYVTELVINTFDGATYNRTMDILANLPSHSWVSETPTSEPAAYLGSRIRPLGEFITYNGAFDDISTTFLEWNDDAYGFAMFALSDSQFAMFEAGSSFAALAMVECCDFGGMETAVGNTPHWLVISNIENIRNTLVGTLHVALHDSSTGRKEIEIPDEIGLSVYPNPFNSAVRISFDYGSESAKPSSTSTPDACRVEVFDINGRRVDKLMLDDLGFMNEGRRISNRQSSTNNHKSAIWTPDESIGSGVYLVRVKGLNKAAKVIYMK